MCVECFVYRPSKQQSKSYENTTLLEQWNLVFAKDASHINYTVRTRQRKCQTEIHPYHWPNYAKWIAVLYLHQLLFQFADRRLDIRLHVSTTLVCVDKTFFCSRQLESLRLLWYLWTKSLQHVSLPQRVCLLLFPGRQKCTSVRLTLQPSHHHDHCPHKSTVLHPFNSLPER